MKKNYTSTIKLIKFIFFSTILGYCIQILSSYSWEIQSEYTWELYKNNNLIIQGLLDVEFREYKTESIEMPSEYDEYLNIYQKFSLCLERELLGVFQEYLKLIIRIDSENEITQNIDDQMLSTFFNKNTQVYNTLNIISSPAYNKRSTLTEIIFLLCCCCLCCDELACNGCSYNDRAEQNLEEASIVRRHELTYNIASYLNITYTDHQGEEVKISNKIEPNKVPIINVFMCNGVSLKWISKILSNQIKIYETLVILPFDERAVKYHIYTHKYPEVEQIENNINPTHKIIFTDIEKPKRKLIIQIHRKCIETILLLSSEYITETNYLFKIKHIVYDGEIYQFPPAYEEMSSNVSDFHEESNSSEENQEILNDLRETYV